MYVITQDGTRFQTSSSLCVVLMQAFATKLILAIPLAAAAAYPGGGDVHHDLLEGGGLLGLALSV